MRGFLVAGEASGDVIGARLMAAMKRAWPGSWIFSGVGGYSMEQEGMKSLFKMEEIAVMGVTELIPHLLTFSEILKLTTKAAVEFKPDVVVTIDSKGFSFRLLRNIKDSYAKSGKSSPLCVHYVAPSFWAWRGGEEKLKNLSGLVDHLLCILPFEEEVCKRNGVHATFVGHPVLEDLFEFSSESFTESHRWRILGNKDRFRETHELSGASPLLTVLPGSRVQELKRMLPFYGAALNQLQQKFPDAAAIIPTVANESLTKMVENSVKSWRIPVTVIPGANLEQKYNAFAASDAALATSGTAVMQLQMARVPSVVAYRASWLTEWIIKRRTKLQYISLPNILLDRPAIPEAIFSSCTSENLACLLRNVLENSSARLDQAAAADDVLCMLQPPQASERPSSIAARVILDALNS